MDLNVLPVILFPHSHITERVLKKTLADFGRLTICQPWFMHASLPMVEKGGLSSVRVLHPPLDLKPKGDFKGLLSEYRLWIRQNRDKGYVTLLKTAQEMAPAEDSAWKVRQMIRRMGEDASAPVNDHALIWHLILHLAREIEENQLDAKEMLDLVKQGKSPLAEALGEEAPLEGLFEDLPLSETQFLMDKHRFRQVFAAWFGLFGEYLPDHGPLLTLDPQVINYAIGLLESARTEPSGETAASFSREATPRPIHITLTHLPRLSDDGDSHRDPVLTGLSGKTIILQQD